MMGIPGEYMERLLTATGTKKDYARVKQGPETGTDDVLRSPALEVSTVFTPDNHPWNDFLQASALST